MTAAHFPFHCNNTMAQCCGLSSRQAHPALSQAVEAALLHGGAAGGAGALGGGAQDFVGAAGAAPVAGQLQQGARHPAGDDRPAAAHLAGQVAGGAAGGAGGGHRRLRRRGAHASSGDLALHALVTAVVPRTLRRAITALAPIMATLLTIVDATTVAATTPRPAPTPTSKGDLIAIASWGNKNKRSSGTPLHACEKADFWAPRRAASFIPLCRPAGGPGGAGPC